MLGIIYDGKSCSQRLKATIQQTGKLGFTQDTIAEMQLSKETYCRIAGDTDSATTLYLAVLRHDADKAFQVMKSGNYFFLNTRQLFDQLGFDYKNKVIIFDIVRFPQYDEPLGGDCYKMEARIKERTRDEKENATAENEMTT